MISPSCVRRFRCGTGAIFRNSPEGDSKPAVGLDNAAPAAGQATEMNEVQRLAVAKGPQIAFNLAHRQFRLQRQQPIDPKDV